MTLRLKSSRFHRSHAPVDCATDAIHCISGDTRNVIAIMLKRVERLFCRNNEGAVVPLKPALTNGSICLVPVALLLVASTKFAGIDAPLGLCYRDPTRSACDLSFRNSDEIAYFQQGTTIILIATRNYALCDDSETGATIRMGQALLADPTFKA